MRNRRNMIIAPHEEGLLLSSWLARRYTYRSMAGWEDEILQGRILVDGKPVLSGLELRKGMLVSYDPPPVPEPEVNRNYSLIHEDPNILIINKPPDLPCHSGGIYLHNTLVSMLKERYGEIYLANRLDRETSGLMIAARNKTAATYMFTILKNRQVEKEYLALVHGNFPEMYDATGWLEKDSSSVIRKKRRYVEDQDAEDPGDTGAGERSYCKTGFACMERVAGYSLLRCTLHTGKTHQIRATLCSLGFPLVGDKIYGRDETLFLRFASGKMTPEDHETLVLNYQALQSSRLAFALPDAEDSALSSYEAPAPDWISLIGNTR